MEHPLIRIRRSTEGTSNETKSIKDGPSASMNSSYAVLQSAARELARRSMPFCLTLAVCLLIISVWSMQKTGMPYGFHTTRKMEEIWQGEMTSISLSEGRFLAIFRITSTTCIVKDISKRRIVSAKCGFITLGETSWTNATFAYFTDQAVHAICSGGGADGSLEPSVMRLNIDTGSVDLLVRKQNHASWDGLVYAAAAEPEGLYVWAKGIAHLHNGSLHGQLECLVDGIASAPLIISQEIVLCPFPQANLTQSTCGCIYTPVTLSLRGVLLPSVASVCRLNSTKMVSAEARDFASFSQPRRSGRLVLQRGYSLSNTSDNNSITKQYYLCVCTMVLDSAKFMEEWLLYHGFLGVEQFFVYDNGSEDGLQESLEAARARGFDFSATIRSWPWLKSQEGAFSHCALLTKRVCTWVMFVDVDEFVFPARMVKKRAKSQKFLTSGSPPAGLLRKFVKGLVKKHTAAVAAKGSRNDSREQIGQITLPCLSFGPSGHQRHPEEGVISGYTCRLELPDRHKSIILTEALAPPMHNVIHHFTSLGHQYRTLNVGQAHGVIFHYKYQAWSEFKTKFRRRASTFVADWTQMEGMSSKDRVPDLGTEGIEPPDWKERYCEVQDSRLKTFSAHVLSIGLDGSIRNIRNEAQRLLLKVLM